MRQNLIQVMNETAPKNLSNLDSFILPYKFWTDVESLARKERESARKAILEKYPPTTTDVGSKSLIVEGDVYGVLYKPGKVTRFDLDTFLDKLAGLGIARHTLRELVDASKIEKPRDVYEVVLRGAK